MKMNQYIKTFIGIVALATTVTACSDDADELLQQAGQQEEGVSPFTRAPIDPTTLDAPTAWASATTPSTARSAT